MKEITVQDCENLRVKFENYCEKAEQHEFPLLLMMDLKMQATLEKIREDGCVNDQKDIRAMFRVILKKIGEDATEYEEEQYGGLG